MHITTWLYFLKGLKAIFYFLVCFFVTMTFLVRIQQYFLTNGNFSNDNVWDAYRRITNLFLQNFNRNCPPELWRKTVSRPDVTYAYPKRRRRGQSRGWDVAAICPSRSEPFAAGWTRPRCESKWSRSCSANSSWNGPELCTYIEKNRWNEIFRQKHNMYLRLFLNNISKLIWNKKLIRQVTTSIQFADVLKKLITFFSLVHK